jgi:hypothetical protein
MLSLPIGRQDGLKNPFSLFSYASRCATRGQEILPEYSHMLWEDLLVGKQSTNSVRWWNAAPVESRDEDFREKEMAILLHWLIQCSQ